MFHGTLFLTVSKELCRQQNSREKMTLIDFVTTYAQAPDCSFESHADMQELLLITDVENMYTMLQYPAFAVDIVIKDQSKTPGLNMNLPITPAIIINMRCRSKTSHGSI